MTRWNSSDDVPKMQRHMYLKAVNQLAGESNSTIETTENAYDFLHNFIDSYENLKISEDYSEKKSTFDQPVKYFEWKTGEDMVLGPAFYSPDSQQHPILDFERNDFDEHVFYLSTSSDESFYDGVAPMPKVTLYGASGNQEEDLLYFGEARMGELADRILHE